MFKFLFNYYYSWMVLNGNISFSFFLLSFQMENTLTFSGVKLVFFSFLTTTATTEKKKERESDGRKRK